MSILATYEKICELNAASSGITSAPTALPGILNDSDLPCALTIPGPGVWQEQAAGLYRQERQYVIRVYCKAVAQGETPDEGFQAVLPVLNALGDTYVRNQSLDGAVDHIGTPDGSQFCTDNGVQVLTYAGIDYHGFELTLNVVEKST